MSFCSRRRLVLPVLAAAALVLPGAASASASRVVQRELAKLGYTVAGGTVAKLHADGSVAAAQPDRMARIALTPNDPYFSTNFGWNFTRTQLPDAWSLTTGAAQTTVAVLDTGVDPATTDLAGALVPGANFVTAGGSTDDDNGHGTEVASLIAARIDNGAGIAGVCGRCSIMPVKVMGSDGTGYWSVVAAGIVWATDHGAKVINLSVGGPVGEDVLARAIQYAQAHDVVVVAAAGNDHVGQPAYPGAYPGVVSVEASDENDNLYSFSNHGSAVTLAAPGCVATIGRGNAMVGACGTSFASPLVAGIAALLRSAQPTFSAAQVIGALESGAQRTGNVDSAYGRVNAYQALTGASTPAGTAPAGPPAPTMAARVSVPTNVRPPSILGRIAVGSTVVAHPGTWKGVLPLRLGFQWQTCTSSGCTNVAGATAPALRLTGAARGRRVRVVVTATNSAGTATATSANSAAISSRR